MLLSHGCDIYSANNDGITPIQCALVNECHVTFISLFLDQHDQTKFIESLSGTEYLMPLIINHVLDPIKHPNSKLTGHLVIEMCKQSASLKDVLHQSAYICNKNGDLPIEMFIKMSGKLKLTTLLLNC